MGRKVGKAAGVACAAFVALLLAHRVDGIAVGSGDDKHQSASGSQEQPPVVSRPVGVDAGPVQSGNQAKNIREDAENNKGELQRFLHNPEAIAGALTFIAICWQSFETRKAARAGATAAEASLRQSKLMEAGMKQWVDFDSWESRLGDGVLHITFQIRNPTAQLILAREGDLLFSLPRQQRVIFLFRPLALGPGKGHEFKFELPLPLGRADDFVHRQILYPIRGQVVFTSSLDREEATTIEGVLVCSLDTTRLEASVRMERGEGDGDE
jgi:hypothetical protein